MKNIICIVTVFFISCNFSFASPPDSITLGIELAKIIAPEKNINNKRYAALLNAKINCQDATTHFKIPKPYIIRVCNTANKNISIITIQNTKTNKSETYSFTSLDLVNFDF
jgi:hypothetical protein